MTTDGIQKALDVVLNRRPELEGITIKQLIELAAGDWELSNLMADVVLAVAAEDPEYKACLDLWADEKLTQ